MNLKKTDPLIILIAGKSGSGKSTLAKYLKEEYELQHKKVIDSPYTKYLKQYIEKITGEKIDENHKPRDLLQQISSKIIKGELKKEDFFIKRQIEDIQIYSYFADVILIADVRFPEEIKVLKDNFSKVISIGIIRKNYISNLTYEQQQDETEIALDNYHQYDFEIENNTDIDLHKKAKEIIQIIKERR